MEELKETVRSRGWVLTIPFKHDGKIIGIKTIKEKLSKYSYVCFQLEKGEEKGYKHWQLMLEHSNPLKFSTLKKIFPFAHIEKRINNQLSVYNYVTKKETRLHGPYEFGDRPDFNDKNTSSGLRQKMIVDISNGMDDFNLLMKYPTLFNKRIIEEYRSALGIKDPYLLNNRDVKVYYISGPAGSGKSSFVRRLFDIDDIYVVSDYVKDPFGSYTGQDVLVLEEYRADFTLSVFLQYLDRYPIMLPARYNNKVAKFTKVFIISNWEFTDQYNGLPFADKKAFWRRLTYIFKIKNDFILRFKFYGDNLKADGSVFNPLGQYGDEFPNINNFDDLMVYGFND